MKARFGALLLQTVVQKRDYGVSHVFQKEIRDILHETE